MAHHHRVYHRQPEKRLAQIVINRTLGWAELQPVVLREGWEEVPWAEMQADFIDTYPEGEIADWGWKLDRKTKRCWRRLQILSYPKGFDYSKDRYSLNYNLALTYTKNRKPDRVVEESWGNEDRTLQIEVYYVIWSFHPWSWWRRFPDYGSAGKTR